MISGDESVTDIQIETSVGIKKQKRYSEKPWRITKNDSEMKSNIIIKVKFTGKDDPLALRTGKIYDAIVGQKGMYCIVDETKEEYAYPPELFEIVHVE